MLASIVRALFQIWVLRLPADEDFHHSLVLHAAGALSCANAHDEREPPLLTQGEADASVMDACMSQDPVCDEGGGDAKTIACFAYPKDKFQDKPTFIAAAFFVAEAPALKTE